MSSILTIVKYKAGIASERLKLMYEDRKGVSDGNNPLLISKDSDSDDDILRVYIKPAHVYGVSGLLVLMVFGILYWSQYLYLKEIPQSTLGIAHHGNRQSAYVASIYAPNLLEEDPSSSGLFDYEKPLAAYEASAVTSSLSNTCMNQVLDFVNGQSLSPISDTITTNLAPAHSNRPMEDRGLVLQHILKAIARSIISFPRNFLQSLVNFVRQIVG